MYGIVGGMDAMTLSDITVSFWAMDFISPLTGTLNALMSYVLIGIGFTLLWTAATRKCPLYSMMGINTCKKEETEEVR